MSFIFRYDILIIAIGLAVASILAIKKDKKPKVARRRIRRHIEDTSDLVRPIQKDALVTKFASDNVLSLFDVSPQMLETPKSLVRRDLNKFHDEQGMRAFHLLLDSKGPLKWVTQERMRLGAHADNLPKIVGKGIDSSKPVHRYGYKVALAATIQGVNIKATKSKAVKITVFLVQDYDGLLIDRITF